MPVIDVDKDPVKQAAQILGAKGGRVKSEAKQKAARLNGKLGGAPRTTGKPLKS